jgi:hypothetical protein
MTQTKHTPGPLSVHKYQHEIEPGEFVFRWSVLENAGTKNERVIADYLDEANAALIAAAPDLLGMLQRVEKFMSGYGTKTQSEMREEIRAAIAKAEGR